MSSQLQWFHLSYHPDSYSSDRRCVTICCDALLGIFFPFYSKSISKERRRGGGGEDFPSFSRATIIRSRSRKKGGGNEAKVSPPYDTIRNVMHPMRKKRQEKSLTRNQHRRAEGIFERERRCEELGELGKKKKEE